MDDDQQIEDRIDEIQRGRSCIYPYQVAREISAEYGIPISAAIEHVLFHIRREMESNS